MKILVTSPSFWPEISGLAKAVSDCVFIISSLGHSVTVVSSTISGVNATDINIKNFGCSGSLTFRTPLRGKLDEYVEWVYSQKFDLIICHAWHAWPTEALLLDNRFDLPPIVVCSHGTSENLFFPNKPFHSIIRFINYTPYRLKRNTIISRVDRLVVLSLYGEERRFEDVRRFLKLGIPISVIPNLANFKPIFEIPTKTARPYILCVGSYDWMKGHMRVLEAYSKSSAKNRIDIKFFGQVDNKYRLKLIEKANSLGINPDFVSFHTGVSGSQLYDAYASALLLLNGSYTECQSLVILDAHAAGLPFVSFNVGDCQRRKSGLVVNSVDEMSSAIDAIISTDLGDNLRDLTKDDLRHHSLEYLRDRWKNLLSNYGEFQ